MLINLVFRLRIIHVPVTAAGTSVVLSTLKSSIGLPKFVFLKSFYCSDKKA